MREVEPSQPIESSKLVIYDNDLLKNSSPSLDFTELQHPINGFHAHGEMGNQGRITEVVEHSVYPHRRWFNSRTESQ